MLKLKTPYMRGDCVVWAQNALNRHGADAGNADGVFGPRSESAVKRFQAARIAEGRSCGGPIGADGKEIPDGKVGRRTAAILAE